MTCASRRFWRLLMLGLVAGCGSAPREESRGIELLDAYAAEPISTDVAAVYLTVWNHGDAPDTLTGAETPLAGMVHLHRMGGIGGSRMQAIEAVDVPAGGQVQLRPGGLHLMLMRLTHRPLEGDTIDLTLRFARAGTVSVRVPIVSYLEVSERAAVGTQAEPR
jgi:periplasmic copper chaperone A